MTAFWPWLTLAALGAFHGFNPAMGWLFAVALGLHRGSRRVVVWALAPMALGHAASIALIAAAVLALGRFVDPSALRAAAGAALIGWAVYHWFYGHRHRVRIGMTTGAAGLALWSFLMATAHGAGLMIVPALVSLCGKEVAGGQGSIAVAIAAICVHMLSMLAVTGAVAVVVHDLVGLDVLRKGWINFDLLWTGMLVCTGAVVLAS